MELRIVYKKVKNLSENQSKIVKYLFKGMTIPQIAKELCCSRSCVSYHINALYSKYKAKNRSEFILSVFGDILDKYKNAFEKTQAKFISKEIENNELKKIIKALISNLNNPINLENIIVQADKYL